MLIKRLFVILDNMQSTRMLIDIPYISNLRREITPRQWLPN